jgi:hypothetical protein
VSEDSQRVIQSYIDRLAQAPGQADRRNKVILDRKTGLKVLCGTCYTQIAQLAEWEEGAATIRIMLLDLAWTLQPATRWVYGAGIRRLQRLEERLSLEPDQLTPPDLSCGQLRGQIGYARNERIIM